MPILGLPTLEGIVAALTVEVTALTARVTALETELVQAQTLIAANHHRIEHLESCVGDVFSVFICRTHGVSGSLQDLIVTHIGHLGYPDPRKIPLQEIVVGPPHP